MTTGLEVYNMGFPIMLMVCTLDSLHDALRTSSFSLFADPSKFHCFSILYHNYVLYLLVDSNFCLC